MSKFTKKDIILEMFNECKRRQNFIFKNDLVKEILTKFNSGTNAYDMTKIDNIFKLPKELIEKNYSIIHLGKGYHEFVQNIQDYIYHKFEDIEEKEKLDWKYLPSILNQFSTSENAILSLSFNQKIIHDFLYHDSHNANPKVYNAERKRGLTFHYLINGLPKSVNNLQIEIDLTTELNGFVTIFEGKNIDRTSNIDNFNVYQIYNPFRYYYELKLQETLPIKEINCCFLIQCKDKQNTAVKIYLYTFDNYLDISSLRLIKKNEYILQKR